MNPDRIPSPPVVAPLRAVKGEALVKALGFNSARTFQRAVKSKKVPVPLYPVPGQSRGFYALARDLVAWQQSQQAASPR